MGRYIATPKTSHAITEVATSAALKTVLQVATPAATSIRILGWGISFDGIVVTNPAGQVTLLENNVAATVTSLTPDLWGSINQPASLCVGGASATGYNASAEGSITASNIIDAQNVHPQTGYAVWYPPDARPTIQESEFVRLRTNFSVDINCIPWIVWDEPA